MTEFEEFIKRARDGGLSYEDIAAGFTKAMNEAQSANKRKEEREAYLSNLRASVKARTDKDLYSYVGAAMIATLAIANAYPDMSVADLKVFNSAVYEALEECGNVFNSICGDDTDHLLDKTLAKVFNIRTKDDDDVKLRRFVAKLK